MIYLLTYNDGYDSQFRVINAYRKIDTLLSQVREMERNENITLEMFNDTDEDGSFEEMLYEIEDHDVDIYDEYGESIIYRYYKINKVMLLN